MRLLYALDLNAKDLWRLKQAAEWAERLNAKLDLLWVDPFGDHAPYLLDPKLKAHLEEELARTRSKDRARLDDVVGDLPENIRGEGLVRSGDPAVAVVSVAGDYDAILVSTRGRKGLTRLWLGSVAERIVRTHSGTTIILGQE